MITICCQNQIFSDIQAIIFDKDGTLEDSQAFLRELAIKRARLLDAQIPGIGEPLLMAFGLLDNTLDPMGLMAVGSRLENEIAAAAYIAETGRGWFEALAIARQGFEEADEYHARNQLTSPIFPDVKPLLQTLSETGIKIGMLSADSTPNIEKFVQKYELSDYIHLMMGANGHWFKPNPALFLHVCEKLNVPPEKTLMVGDSSGDMQMAKAAKAAGTIGIVRSQVSLPDADVIINNLNQIILG